jgi:hypothetical protein
VNLELSSCEKQTYLFFKISSSYLVQAGSCLYKKVWFLVTLTIKIQVYLDARQCWPVNAVTLSEDISRKIQQIWLTKQENVLKSISLKFCNSVLEPAFRLLKYYAVESLHSFINFHHLTMFQVLP